MLTQLSRGPFHIIYASYEKKYAHFSQSEKEDLYIQLLVRLLAACQDEVDVVFDSFGLPSFESRIIEVASLQPKVSRVCAKNSELVPGLQFVDNICSVIRRHITGTDHDSFYQMIENIVKST